VSNFKCYSFP